MSDFKRHEWCQPDVKRLEWLAEMTQMSVEALLQRFRHAPVTIVYKDWRAITYVIADTSDGAKYLAVTGDETLVQYCPFTKARAHEIFVEKYRGKP